MKELPGDKVLITYDGRDGGMATGEYGIYEGEFPYRVIFMNRGSVDNWAIDSFIRGDAMIMHNGILKPIVLCVPQVVTSVEMALTENYVLSNDPDHRGAMGWAVYNNPRIRLADGSTIWGMECHWQLVDEGDDIELDIEIETLAEYMNKLRGMIAKLNIGDIDGTK